MGARKLRMPEISLIEFGGMRFLIMDTPRNNNINQFVRECSDKNVTDVVRVCEKLYPEDEFSKANIKVHDFEFKDGSPPTNEIIDSWLELVSSTFFEPDNKKLRKVIAVHCLAGLGRAPILVAIALMEMGMENQQAITYIREKRHGAFNKAQLEYIMNYQSKRRLKMRKAMCIVM